MQDDTKVERADEMKDKFGEYARFCKRCQNIYKTIHKYSDYCKNCNKNLLRKNER